MIASPKAAERRQFLAGCIVLTALVAAFAGVSRREGGAQAVDTATTMELAATFGRIDGVRPGTEVRLAGVPVGAVRSMALRDDFRVDVRMGLDRAAALPEDSGATIETDGVFGDKYIELTPGGAMDLLPAGGRISYTQDSVIVEELLAKIVALGHAARKTAKGDQP